jgi:hypothetical protein
MHITPLLRSRMQFAFTVSFHIIFPPLRSGSRLGLLFMRRSRSRPASRSTVGSSTSGSACSQLHLGWVSSRASS